jgi:hypothetical protein
VPAAPKLLEEASIVARLKHLSLRTEKVYLQRRHSVQYGSGSDRIQLCSDPGEV